MQDFRNLKVWQKAHALTLAIYRSTTCFPAEERFGITSQLRRSCASIAANIAEGCGRGGDTDFARFIRMAKGSASEADYHLLLAKDLGFLDGTTYETLFADVSEVRRMLNALERTLKSSQQILANS